MNNWVKIKFTYFNKLIKKNLKINQIFYNSKNKQINEFINKLFNYIYK